MISIDGSFGSGGGQIVRTALSLSSIFEKPCEIFNIRKGRSDPGLKPQHLKVVESFKELSGAYIKGAKVGSEKITFYPKEKNTKDLKINIDTAASITLILQALIPFLLISKHPREIIIKGGATDTFFSPTFDYFYNVFYKNLEKFTKNSFLDIKVKRRGFYPEGGAYIKIKTSPTEILPIKIKEKGELKKVKIISGASEDLKSKKVAKRQKAGVKEVLGKLNFPTEEEVNYYETDSTGSCINVIGKFENINVGFDNLGKIKKSAEQVGKEPAQEFLNFAKTKEVIDKHFVDQIIPYLPFSPKKAEVSVPEKTSHLKTNIWVTQKFTNGLEEKENKIVFHSSQQVK